MKALYLLKPSRIIKYQLYYSEPYSDRTPLNELVHRGGPVKVAQMMLDMADEICDMPKLSCIAATTFYGLLPIHTLCYRLHCPQDHIQYSVDSSETLEMLKLLVHHHPRTLMIRDSSGATPHEVIQKNKWPSITNSALFAFMLSLYEFPPTVVR